MLEDLLVKTQAKSGGSHFPLSDNTKENIPIGRVKPLMKKSQPAFCQTPSANKENTLDTLPSDGCLQGVGKSLEVGRSMMVAL